MVQVATTSRERYFVGTRCARKRFYRLAVKDAEQEGSTSQYDQNQQSLARLREHAAPAIKHFSRDQIVKTDRGKGRIVEIMEDRGTIRVKVGRQTLRYSACALLELQKN